MHALTYIIYFDVEMILHLRLNFSHCIGLTTIMLHAIAEACIGNNFPTRISSVCCLSRLKMIRTHTDSIKNRFLKSSHYAEGK